MTLKTFEDATSAVLSFSFSGALGPAKDKSVIYSLFKETDNSFTFMVSLCSDTELYTQPIDRYLVVLDRITGEIERTHRIELDIEECRKIFGCFTKSRITKHTRFTDGSLSLSYKVTCREYETEDEVQYVVQLRHHADVSSMNAIMQLVSSTIDPSVLPVPQVYPISDEGLQRTKLGMGIQITRFVSGIMGDRIYPSLSHENKLIFIKRLARAFGSLWNIPLPPERLIGELKARTNEDDDRVELSVGPDRRYSLGGPFGTVADYLRAYIRARLFAFQKQQGIDEYKSQYLKPVEDFVKKGMLNIPAIVEVIPVVPVNTDMALHNIIVSETDPTNIMAIIDWEYCDSAPYACAFPVIEQLFRQRADNGFGLEYPDGLSLREAFWNEIPEWKRWNESEAGTVFLEWFCFGLFMKAEMRPGDVQGEEKANFWAENKRVVEGFLAKYDS